LSNQRSFGGAGRIQQEDGAGFDGPFPSNDPGSNGQGLPSGFNGERVRDDDDEDEEEDDGDGHEVDDPDVEAAELYLHIIVTDGLSGKKQIPPKVTHLATDYDLSDALNRAYRRHRGSWRALFMVESLRPTKYMLFNQQRAHLLRP
jgi:hypothetical protein